MQEAGEHKRFPDSQNPGAHLLEPTFTDLAPRLPLGKVQGLASFSDSISLYCSLLLNLNLEESSSEGK